jgi:hypothetical protein
MNMSSQLAAQGDQRAAGLSPSPGAVNQVFTWTNSDSFQPMERLLATWLAGARLVEIARVVQLAKAELARRATQSGLANNLLGSAAAEARE